ncbi:MAG: PAS domain S-box protein [Proteobacteria bacterium]|nr:PAS domain S-box protein [Pseudomonadota bacterium]MBU1583169.1 PAS domain S-box protein [Pseudomonadota bacterium]
MAENPSYEVLKQKVKELEKEVLSCNRLKTELEASREKHQTILDNIVEGYYEVDLQGNFIFFNNAMQDILGFEKHEMLGMNNQAFMEKETARKVFKTFNQVFQTGKPSKTFDWVLIRKDGKKRYIETSISLIRSVENNPIGFRGIARDVTEIRQAEMALRESEEKFRLTFMTSPDSINLNRLSDGMFIDINTGFTQIMGYTRNDVLSKTSAELNIWVDIKDREWMVAQLKKHGVVKNMEARFRSKDGTIRHGLMSASIIRFEQEDVILSIVRDITEQKRTQEVLIQSEKMLSVGGLAAGMAHEINNPLAGILQNAQVIANRLSADHPMNQKAAEKIGVPMDLIVQYMEQRKIFELISSLREAGNRAADIVSNILSFSRKSDLFPSEFNIKKLMDATIEIAGNDYDLKKNIDFRKISILREYEDTAFYVECNGSNIQQVFLNILRNAAEALFDKKMKIDPRIIIRILGEKNGVRIEIEDNGPGIEEVIRKRVFEPFFTTKPVGLGTGLGLSVSYFIITENHKGRIFVTSLPGQGAKFVITLPFKHSDQQDL